MSEYKKCCYWVDFQRLEAIRKHLEKEKVELQEETHIPCRVLRSSMEIGCVVPQAWEGSCKRRTSWYLSSEKSGKFLIVSNGPLDLSGLGSPILITNSDFMPDRLPSFSEIAQLVQSRSFQRAKPPRWDKPRPLERDFYRRWFERFRVDGLFDFGEILVSHSANHANFIDPRFFALGNAFRAPYSIGDSIHVCSSCIEFFNVLGEQWPVKYVVPCIGAVQVAHLPQDHYFRIETQ